MDAEKKTLPEKAVLKGKFRPKLSLVGTMSSRTQLTGSVRVPKVIEVEYVDTFVLVLKDGTEIPCIIVEPPEDQTTEEVT